MRSSNRLLRGTMTEVLFYHLERAPLERVLPSLLEKVLERGWKAVIQAGSRERVEALDSILWTYREESFVPHGIAGGGDEELQPILITDDVQNPNGATVRFFVDGANLGDPPAIDGYDRIVYLFDGNDENARGQARISWKAVKETGADVTYWQQSEQGRWEKRA